LGFGTSSALASAYGIAVTLTMFITTLLTFFVVRYAWKLPLWLACGATGFFLVIDGILAASCSIKFMQGGWFPLLMAAAIFAVMATWRRGRELLMAHLRSGDPGLRSFVQSLLAGGVTRVQRTAVFLVADPATVPHALLHNLKHNMVLHARNVLLTVVFHEVPHIPDEERLEVEPLEKGFWRVRVNYGFNDSPDIPQALAECRPKGIEINLFETSYFLSRETLVPTPGGGMANWRERLFATLSRNAGGVVDYFRIPANSVIELGSRIEI
jgi:KUP system potassium uptake protein